MLQTLWNKTKKVSQSMKETIEMIKEARSKKKLRQMDALLDNLDGHVEEILKK